MTLLVVCPLCLIWAFLGLHWNAPNESDRISVARSLRTEQEPQSDNARELPKSVVDMKAKSHSEGTDVDSKNMWLEERAHIYKQRREMVKTVCEKSKSIHNSREGERFVSTPRMD